MMLNKRNNVIMESINVAIDDGERIDMARDKDDFITPSTHVVIDVPNIVLDVVDNIEDLSQVKIKILLLYFSRTLLFLADSRRITPHTLSLGILMQESPLIEKIQSSELP